MGVPCKSSTDRYGKVIRPGDRVIPKFSADVVTISRIERDGPRILLYFKEGSYSPHELVVKQPHASPEVKP